MSLSYFVILGLKVSHLYQPSVSWRTTCRSKGWFLCQMFVAVDYCFYPTLLETRRHSLFFSWAWTDNVSHLEYFHDLCCLCSQVAALFVWQRVMRRRCLERKRGTSRRQCERRGTRRCRRTDKRWYTACLCSGTWGTECVSASDLFISFHSSCQHTKRLLSQIFLSISHPLLFPPSSPFPVCPPLFNCVF